MTSPSFATPPVPSRVNLHPKVVRAHRTESLVTFGLGLLGVLGLGPYLWHFGFGLFEALTFVVWYLAVMGAGLCVGYHRYFSHGAFQTGPAMRRALVVLGSMAGQGPLTYWVAVHRRHHELGDEEGDPHSPHQGRGLWSGLWHGHFGWSLGYGMPSTMHYCPDVVRDEGLMRWVRRYRLWVVLGLVLPPLLGGLVTWSWEGALGGLLFGALLRTFLSSHSTWSLNSFCHRVGTRPFATRDESRNVAWLALPTLGESWHNNHHAHPSSARHGLGRGQLDVNHGIITLLERLKWVWKVKRA